MQIQLKFIALVIIGVCEVLNYAECNFLYDDSHIRRLAEQRYPALLHCNASLPRAQLSPRDCFNFSQIFEPTDEYVESIGIETVIYNELRMMEVACSIATMDQWHYTNDTIGLQKIKSHDEDDRVCKSQLAQLHDMIAGNDTLEANDELFQRGARNHEILRVLDAWARPPSETYIGHSYWVGSYRECMNRKLNFDGNQNKPTTFRYCWAKLRPKSWPTNDDITPPVTIRAGICLPRTCGTKSANSNKALIKKIMHKNYSPMHRSRFDLITDVYCLPDEPPQVLPDASRTFARLMIGWITLIILISVYAHFAPDCNSSLGLAISKLSLQSNYASLIADDAPKSNGHIVDLRPVGSLRFVASLATVIGHVACTMGWVANSSGMAIDIARNIAYASVPSLFKSVDVFLVLTGLLTSYMILSKYRPGAEIRRIVKPRTYLMLNIIRSLRLAPAFIVVMAFMRFVYVHIGSGPFWDYGTYKHSIQGQCQRSSVWRAVAIVPQLVGSIWPSALRWLMPYEEVPNPYANECLATSWYVYADMKLFMLTPLLIYAIAYNRKANEHATNWKPVALALAISTLHHYKDLALQETLYFAQFFKYSPNVAVNILHLTFGEPAYFSVLNRLYALTIGLYAGAHLHRYKRSNGAQIWPWWMRGWPFKIMLVWLAFDNIFAPIIAHHNYRASLEAPSEAKIMLIMLIGPRLDAIMFAIIALRICTDLAPRMMRLGALPMYKLSKLTYCVYLVHAILISYTISSHEHARYNLTHLDLAVTSTFVTVASFLISLPLYLLVESPIAQLLNQLHAMFAHKRSVLQKKSV